MEYTGAHIEAAILIAGAAHKGQKYGKYPYMVHLARVDALVWEFNEEELGSRICMLRAIAYLHDILEDTNLTYEELKTFFGEEIAEAVRCITKVEGESYKNYIKKVKINEASLLVKKADTLANLQASVESEIS